MNSTFYHLKRLALVSVMLFLQLSAWAQLNLTSPIDRIVYQRNKDSKAFIPIRGNWPNSTTRIDARAVARTGQGQTTGWFTIATSATNGQFQGSLPAMGGWYTLEVRAMSGPTPVATASIERVGVGEVFVVAGHSVAHGQEINLAGSDDERVSTAPVFPGTTTYSNYEKTANPAYLPRNFTHYASGVTPAPFAHGTYFWAKMAQSLTQRLGVPVLIFNAAFGGSSLEHWAKSALGQTFNHAFINSSIGMPYVNVKNALQVYGTQTGVRGILSDHGQNDWTNKNEDQVFQYYLTWVNQARSDLGFPSLAIVVNRQTPYKNKDHERIRRAQERMIRSGNCFPGPDYDLMTNADRPDGVHLSSAGAAKAAQFWASALNDAFFKDSAPYVLSELSTAQPVEDNQPPVAPTVSALSATVGIAYQSVALPVFTDPNNDPLTYTLAGLPGGLRFDVNTRVVSGTPTTSGTFSLTYSATDNKSAPVTTNVALTVINPTPTNQPPVAPTVSALSATVGSAYQSAALPVFTDPNNDLLTYTLAGLPGGLSFNTNTRVISGTPTTSGTFSLTYSATDNKSAPVTTNVALIVSNPTPTNQPPVAPTVSALSGTVNVAFTAGALPVFTDPNSDPLTYSLTGLPSGLNFNANTRVISGTPTQAGSFSLTYSAHDGKVQTSVFMNLSVAGSVVVTGNFEGYLTQEASCSSLTGWVFDRNRPDMPFTVEFFDGASIAAGTLLGSTLANEFRQHLKDAGKGNGEHWYVFPIPREIKDGQNHTIWARVQGSDFILKWAPKTINCPAEGTPTNQLPVAPVVSTLIASVNTSFTSAPLAPFTDPENTPLTYTLTGLPNDLTFNAGTRVISGTPTTSGTFSLTYSATDQPGGKSSVVFSLVIDPATLPTNQPPVAPTVSGLSATVGSAYQSAALAVFIDPNNDELTYSLTGLPGGLSFDAGTRVISGTPTTSGTFSLTYSATDKKSAPVTTNVALTIVNPTPTNQPPVAPPVSALSATMNVAFTAGALPVFTDPNNDPLTYSLTGLPSGLNFNANTRVIAGTPTQQGSFSLTYSAHDGKVQTSVTVSLSVAAPSTAPAANFDGYLVQEASCDSLSGWAFDRTNVNAHLTIEFFEGATMETATLFASMLASTYQQHLKDAGKGNGEHWFSLTIPRELKDGRDHIIWARVQGSDFILKWAPKTINCPAEGTPTNQPPVAPTVSALSGTVKVAFTSGALPVFTDPNSDPLTYALTGLPGGLSFNANTRVVSGTPTTSGTFSLTYSATDNKSAPVTTNVALIVSNPSPTNQPPVAPTVSALSGTVNVAFTAGALPVFTDPNSDPLTYSLTGLPSGLNFNANTRVISGTPTQAGSFSLTYSAHDGKVQTSVFMNLSVAGSVVVTGNFEGYLTQEASCSSLTGWVFDRNRPDMPFTVEFFDGASIAAGTLLGSTLANEFRQHLKDAGKGNGEHWYVFPIPREMKDGQNHTIWARVQGSDFILKWAPKTINCPAEGTSTNQPPVAPTVSALSATVSVAFTSAALPVFTDPNNDPLTYALTGLPAGFNFNASTRVISGTTSSQGNFNLTYLATDGNSAAVSTTVLLTVNANGKPTDPPTNGGSGPGNYEGYLDVVDCSYIRGWIWDRNRPNQPITVEFLDGAAVVGQVDADIFRQDLKDAGKGNGAHGYSFLVPASLKDGQPHSISGRVPGSTFVLKWSPKPLTCPNLSGRRVAAESAEISLDLRVSPNPSEGLVEISYRVDADQRTDLQVIDMMGRTIWQKTVVGTGRVERETIDLRSAGAAVYLIQLKTAHQGRTKRLVISR